jgi:hypothetical protein
MAVIVAWHLNESRAYACTCCFAADLLDPCASFHARRVFFFVLRLSLQQESQRLSKLELVTLEAALDSCMRFTVSLTSANLLAIFLFV